MTRYEVSEYGQVIRLHAAHEWEISYHPGYAFVPESQALHVRQYCREMTLARGRMLYAVWDEWTNHFLGHVVPEEIVREARATQPANALTPWPNEHYTVRANLHRTLALVTDRFSRVPACSAKMIAEDIYRHQGARSITKKAVENAVVEHARWYYTSYQHRVQEMGVKEGNVIERIQPRMREVLRSWVPHETHSRELAELFHRHDLLSLNTSGDERAKGENEQILEKYIGVPYYAGAGMAGHLMTNWT